MAPSVHIHQHHEQGDENKPNALLSTFLLSNEGGSLSDVATGIFKVMSF